MSSTIGSSPRRSLITAFIELKHSIAKHIIATPRSGASMGRVAGAVMTRAARRQGSGKS